MKRNGKTAGVGKLVERAKAGDREAFDALVRQFQPTVWALSMKILRNDWDAQDVSQEVWLQVSQKIAEVREPERFAGWLRQVTLNLAYAAANKDKRRKKRVYLETNAGWEQDADSLLSTVPARGSLPPEEAMRVEEQQAVQSCLAGLPEADRQAMEAFYIRGLTLKEVSCEQVVPVGTVKSRLNRGRERFKAQWMAAHVERN